MAEAVATIGASVLTFVLGKIDEVLKKEFRLYSVVKDGIKNLKNEMGVMIEFLDQHAAAQGHYAWAEAEIRQIAHDIEDVLDQYEYKSAQENTPWHSKNRWKKDKGNLYIKDSIQRIDTQLKELKRIVRYPHRDAFSDNNPAPENFHHEIASYFTPDDEIVGLKQPSEKLISWVLDDGQSYKEMFVVGMGGSGKTTLVKLVYERLKQDFNYYVWLNSSRPMESEQLLRTMLAELCNQHSDYSRPPPPPPTLHRQGLISNIRTFLQDKRYLIVFDGLWSKRLWENVKSALPNDKDTCGRVIITTQRGDIASSSREGSSVDVYNIHPLPTETAKSLFYKHAFPPDGICPLELSEWSEKLLTKCRGLPLGIIEIGKLASRTDGTNGCLEKLHGSLRAELGSTKGKLSSIRERLILNYYDLPYPLKCCFQFTSMFPEDRVIKRTTLIRMWVAEGFIREETGKQVEDIGEEYIKELVDRNLMQMYGLDVEGRPRTFKIHNLMHKIIVELSESQNFCTIYTNNHGGDQYEKIRRLSIQTEKFDRSKELPQSVRSLLSFTPRLKTISHISSCFMLLKTLHLEDACVETFPKGTKYLLLLKYLCLSKTNIKFIPRSIGRLQLLETLILKETLITDLPKTMGNLENLKHLACYRKNAGGYEDVVQGVTFSLDIIKLAKLQTLLFVKATKQENLIKDLGKLTHLRKLGILDLPRSSGLLLCDSLKMLKNLQSLNLTSVNRDEVLEIQKLTEPPPHLKRLCLKGQLEEIPRWILNLHDLVRLQLQWSKLKNADNNPLSILEDLRSLVELQLIDAYTGPKLEFNAGKFQKLNKLVLEKMGELREVSINKRALPCLKRLILTQCQKLMIVDELTQVEELQLIDMAPGFVNLLRREGGKRHLVPHVRKIFSTRSHNGVRIDEDLL